MFRAMFYSPFDIPLSEFVSARSDSDVLNVKRLLERPTPLLEDVAAWTRSANHEGYKTLIIDNWSNLEEFIRCAVCGKDTGIYDLPYGVGEGRMTRALSRITDFWDKSGMNIVILANASTWNVPDVHAPTPHTAYAPCVHRCLSNPLMNWLDILGAVTFEYRREKAESDAEVVKRLYLSGSPTCIAGWRFENSPFNLDAPLELDGASFFAKLDSFMKGE